MVVFSTLQYRFHIKLTRLLDRKNNITWSVSCMICILPAPRRLHSQAHLSHDPDLAGKNGLDFAIYTCEILAVSNTTNIDCEQLRVDEPLQV